MGWILVGAQSWNTGTPQPRPQLSIHLRVCLKPIVESNDILVSQFSHNVHLPLQREQVLGTFVQFGDKLERHNLHSQHISCLSVSGAQITTQTPDGQVAYQLGVFSSALVDPSKGPFSNHLQNMVVLHRHFCYGALHLEMCAVLPRGLAVGRCRASCSTSATFPREIR